MVEDLFDVAWTPDFTEDLLLAVEYLRNRLRAPKAARDLYDGVVEALENQRAMPTAAVVKWGANGSRYYTVTCGKFAVYYTIEGKTIKALALKHQLQK